MKHLIFVALMGAIWTGTAFAQRYVDVNGDGYQDHCQRTWQGIECSLGGSNYHTLWTSNYSDSQGWNKPYYHDTIRFADINGDRYTDVCGRSANGMVCSLSDGREFRAMQNWSTEFSNGNGWAEPQYYRTIDLYDQNNDGRADVCATGLRGYFCLYSNGTQFVGNGGGGGQNRLTVRNHWVLGYSNFSLQGARQDLQRQLSDYDTFFRNNLRNNSRHEGMSCPQSQMQCVSGRDGYYCGCAADQFVTYNAMGSQPYTQRFAVTGGRQYRYESAYQDFLSRCQSQIQQLVYQYGQQFIAASCGIPLDRGNGNGYQFHSDAGQMYFR